MAVASPGVNLKLIEGNLPPAPTNVDGIFAGIGACLFGQANGVYFLTDPSQVPIVLGNGPLAEMASQILSNGSAGFYAVPAHRTQNASGNGIGSVQYSRSAIPSLSVQALMGMPNGSLSIAQPLSPAAANTGNGSVSFAVGSVPQPAAVNATLSVAVTTAGPLGTAQASITVGSNAAQTGVTLGTSPWADGTGLTMAHTGSGTATATVTTPGTAGVPVTVTLTNGAGTPPTSGTLVIANAITSAVLSTQTVPLTTGTSFTDPVTGFELTFSGSGSFVAADTYTANLSGILLSFSTPSAGGNFAVGDSFSAIATPNDGYNVSLSVQSISNAGQAQLVYSLDGNNTTQTIPVQLGGTVVATGSTAPALTLGGSWPTSQAAVSIACTQGGSALGVVAQCTPSSGVLTKTSGTGTLVATITTASSYTAPVIVSITPTVASPTTEVDITIKNAITGATVSSASAHAVAGSYTDATTGIVIGFTGSPASGDVYASVTVQSPAIFTYTVNGTATTGVYINSSGQPSNSSGTQQSPNIPGISGPTLRFPLTNTALYTYSATTPSLSTTYALSVYPQPIFTPAESNGTLCGLTIAFGFGTYLAGDTMTFSTTAPQVAQADVLAANTALQATKGVLYSMLHVAPSLNVTVAGKNPYQQLATLASALQSAQTAFSQSPHWRLVPFLLYGPDLRDSVSGVTPTDFANAFINIACNIGAITTTADFITSALTGRLNIVNCGYSVSARLAAVAPQIDPGQASLGGLPNDVNATAPTSDALSFNLNRGMATRTYASTAGVYVVTGVSLESPTGDYTLVALQRVIAKVYNAAYVALLPYVNVNVPTTSSGTIDPKYAGAMGSNVAGIINSACPGNYQSLTVSPSLTQNVQTTRTLPVTVLVQPFGYLEAIDVSVGFQPIAVTFTG